MKQWRDATLGEVATFQRGFDITKDEQHPGPYPVISSSGFNSTHSHYKAAGPGVVIGRKGSLGTVFYYPGNYWPHDTTLWVRDFHGNDEKFVYYFLQTLELERYDVGASNPTLNRNHIHLLPVLYPPVQVQRKIAAILSAYDDLIENNTRRIAILEEMAQAIYREWFVHFRFPGHEDVEMVETGVGMVPEGWKIAKLKEVCDLTLGQSPPSKYYNEERKGLPFHQGVADFGNRFPTDRRWCTVTDRTAEAGDILFSVRAPVGRMNLARRTIVIGRGLHAIRSKAGDQAFIYQQLQEKFHEEDMMGSGTIFKSVTKKDMQNIELLIPPASLRGQFESIMQPIYRHLEILTDKNQILRTTRDLLLPRLMSRELDLSE